ncbi:MAG: SpoVR family protein [Halobacteriovoraceae bacterium]|nr:SpoVR family protein [Halobacteriovoraceae bacterium]
MKKLLYISILSLFVFNNSFCEDLSSVEDCAKYFEPVKDLQKEPGKIRITSSGRDANVLPELVKVSHEIGQIAHDLGYYVPPHMLTFVPTNIIGAMIASVGYPSPHWIDGHKIVTEAPKLTGVMEFVTGGNPTVRSVYKDTTDIFEQISIIAHVAGHNHVSKSSPYMRLRLDDTIKASSLLEKAMSKYKDKYGSQEVDHWYQYLNSANYLQDILFGSYHHVGDLKKKIEHKEVFPATRSVLSAMIASFPKDTPAWKIKMAELFEERTRFFGANGHLQVINEGWATFSQYLLVKYLADPKYTSSHASLRYAQLLSHVAIDLPGQRLAQVSLNNPYWLGLQGFFELYRKFKLTNEISPLIESQKELKTHEEKLKVEFEIDKKFVAFVTNKYISKYNDVKWIEEVYDNAWLKKKKFVIGRQLTENEIKERGLFDPQNPKEYLVVLSNDKKRVLDKVKVQLKLTKKIQLPDIEFIDPKFKGNGILLRHNPFLNMPLEISSAVQTLYVLTKINSRSVSIETVLPSTWFPTPELPFSIPEGIEKFTESDWQKFLKQFGAEDRAKIEKSIDLKMIKSIAKKQKMPTIPALISVHTDGQVDAFIIEKEVETTEDENLIASGYVDPLEQFMDKKVIPQKIKINLIKLPENFTEQLKRFIKIYQDDLSINFDPKYWIEYKEKWESIMTTEVHSTSVSDHNLAPQIPVLHHVSSAGQAMLEFDQMAKRRMDNAIKKILSGKAPLIMGQKGVQVPALPIIPHFHNDTSVLSQLMTKMPPSPIDGEKWLAGLGLNEDEKRTFHWIKDLNTQVIVIDADPGTLIPIPPKQEGEGKGEGTESDESQEGEEEGEGQQGDGQGDGDVKSVEIPYEAWGQILKQELKLKNIRKTFGRSQRPDTERDGVVQHDRDPIIWDKTLEEAYILGMAKFEAEGIETSELDDMDIVEEGLSRMRREEYYTKTQRPIMEPDFDAVVVFAVDMSASMANVLFQAKKFVRNVVALLRANYKNIDVRFVAFSSEAVELPERKFWSSDLGYSTTYSEGVKKSHEILEEYPRSRFNKYFYLIGDAGNFASDFDKYIASFDELLKNVDHSGFVYTVEGWEDPQFLKLVQDYGQGKDNYDYTEIDSNDASILRALRDLFSEE